MSDIVRYDGRAAALAVPIRNVDDLLFLGSVLAASGFFKNTVGENQAAAKILAGMELGISPVASLRGLYIVEGQITLAYPLIGALIKKSGKYDYRIRTNTAEECVVEFFEKGESVGFSSLTMKQAKERGLDQYSGGKVKEPWKKFPENMLLSKCLSNGAKAHTSEVFYGPIYTPDELGMEVDGATGIVVEVERLPKIQLIPCEAEGCQNTITDYTNEQGRTMSAAKIIEGTQQKYGKALCWDCAQKAKAGAEAQRAKFEAKAKVGAEARENRRKAEERDNVKSKSNPAKVDVLDENAKVSAKKALEDARKRYEEASDIGKQLAFKEANQPDYRQWNAAKLNEATEELTLLIQSAITGVAIQDVEFLAEDDGDGLPDETQPLTEWMACAVAWELIQTIRAENLNSKFELDELSEEEVLEEIPH